MDDCIFCKLVKSEIPSYKVFENDFVLAFLDIAPVNPGHTLVIPKVHYANFEEIPQEYLFEIMKIVQRVGRSLKDNLHVAGYNVLLNNDPVAGQIVNHLHFHLIPRKESDGLHLWPQGKYGEVEAEEILNKIKL